MRKSDESFLLSADASSGSVIGCLHRKAVDVHGEPPEVAVHPRSATKTGPYSAQLSVFASNATMTQQIFGASTWRLSGSGSGDTGEFSGPGSPAGGGSPPPRPHADTPGGRPRYDPAEVKMSAVTSRGQQVTESEASPRPADSALLLLSAAGLDPESRRHASLPVCLPHLPLAHV